MPRFQNLLLVLSAALAPAAHAAVITTADGVGADNQVMGLDGQNRHTLNKGGGSNIELRNNTSTPGNNFVGVLRFDLSSVTIGADQTIEATLNITQNDLETTAATINVYGLNDGYAGGADGLGAEDEFAEAGYTEGVSNFSPGGATDLRGDNAPGFIENQTGVDMIDASLTTLLGAINVPANSPGGTTVSLTGSAALNSFLTQAALEDDVAVIYLVNATDNANVAVLTKDGGAGPNLNVTVIVPEPGVGAMGLGAMGLLIATARRR